MIKPVSEKKMHGFAVLMYVPASRYQAWNSFGLLWSERMIPYKSPGLIVDERKLLIPIKEMVFSLALVVCDLYNDRFKLWCVHSGKDDL